MSMMGDMGAATAADPAAAAAGAAAGTAGATTDTTTTAATAAAGATPSYAFDLPEEYRANEGLAKFVKDGKVDGSAVLKSYAHLESMNGRDKIAVPKSDEEWGAVYDKLGRPADASKYEVTKPQLPEGVTYDEEGEKFMRDFGHKNGWNQKQFSAAYQALFERQASMQGEWAKMDSEAKDKCAADLKREHGDAYDANLQAGAAAMQQFLDPDFYQFLESRGLANDPRMVRPFIRIGKEMMGDSALKGGGGNNATLTPQQWDSKIADFRKEHAEALRDSDHKDYKTRAAELREMYQRKHGEIK